MKEKNHKKLIVASALAVGAVAGVAALAPNQSASAADGNAETSEEQTTEKYGRPELSEDASRREKPADMTDEEWEQKKAERKEKMKAKLEAMTDEEKQAWLESHKKQRTSTEE